MGEQWSLAVDYGTTSTAAAVSTDGAEAQALTQSNNVATPSSVFAQGSTLVSGTLADNQAMWQSSAYEETPKRRINEDPLPLGGHDFTQVEVIAAVLGPVIAEAIQQHNDTQPTELVCTHPVRWTETYRRLLATAVQKAQRDLGVREPIEPRLVSEPVAAARWFTRNAASRPGDCLAVYDLGGGTFDTTVLRATDAGSFEEVNSGGDPRLGGVDFDYALFTYLGERFIHAADPGLWAALSSPKTDRDDPQLSQQRFQLWQRARIIKERLSNDKYYTTPLPGVQGTVTVTRADYEALIADRIDETIDELENTITDAGLQLGEISVFYRIGGAARTPLVGLALRERLGPRVRGKDDPKLVVARGAITSQPRQEPTSDKTNPDDEPPRDVYRRAVAAAELGDPPTAIRAYQQTIDLSVKPWSAEASLALAGIPLANKITARALDAVAAARVGDFVAACRVLDTAIWERSALLGAEHPDTLSARRDAAIYRMLSGENSRAAKEFAALVASERQRSNPWALVCEFYHSRCVKEDDVDDLYLSRMRTTARDLLTGHLSDFSPEEPETVEARLALAYLSELDGRYRQAVELYTEAVEISTRVHGSQHSTTLDLRLKLAIAMRMDNDATAATHELEAVVAGLAATRGPADPDTLFARAQLAATRNTPADTPDWSPLLQDVARRLGADHPTALYVRHCHAEILARTKQYTVAKEAFTALVADRTRILGLTNLATMHSRWKLAIAAGQGGDPACAAVELNRLMADLRGRAVTATQLDHGLVSARVKTDLDTWWKQSTGPARVRYSRSHQAPEHTYSQREAWLRF